MKTTQAMESDPQKRPVPPATPAQRGSGLALVLFGLLLIVWGGGWVLDSLDVVRLPVGALLAVSLIAVGLALLADAGHHARGGLVALGVVLTAALVVAAAASTTRLDVTPSDGVGDRVVRPTTVAELGVAQRLGAGTLTVDLRGVTLPTGVTTVTARVGTGRLVVQVPPGTPFQVRGRVGTGQVRALGQSRGGIEVDTMLTDEWTGGGFGTAERALRLDLRVGVGDIEVQR